MLGPAVLRMRLIIADCQDSAIPDSEGLGNGKGRLVSIHGQHLPVVENEVCIMEHLWGQILGLRHPDGGSKGQENHTQRTGKFVFLHRSTSFQI